MDGTGEAFRESVVGGPQAPAHVETRTLLDPNDATRSRRIEWHLACSVCGYDLFDLDREGVCPECGTSVAMSTRGWLMRDLGASAARWYSRSAMLAAVGTLLTPLLAIVVTLVEGARTSANRSAPMLPAIVALEVALGIALLGAVASWIMGWWGITRARDHVAWRRAGGSGALALRIARGVVRVCSLTIPAGLAVLYVGARVAQVDPLMYAGFGITLASLAAMLVSVPAVLRMLGQGLPVTRVAGGAKVLQVFGIVIVVLNSICLPTMILPLMISTNFVSGLIYFCVLIACLVDISLLAGNEARLASGGASGSPFGRAGPRRAGGPPLPGDEAGRGGGRHA